MPLSRDEIEEIRLHAHRYAGPFTPTFQRLAANIGRLVSHILENPMPDDLPTTEENAAAASHADHILRGAEELKRRQAVEGWREKTLASSDRYHAAPAVPIACRSCQWWDEQEHGRGRGLCRAALPQADVGGDGVWPVTRGDDWCRLHEPAAPHPLRVHG